MRAILRLGVFRRLTASPAAAQEAEALIEGDVDWSLFAGVSFKLTEMVDEFAVVAASSSSTSATRVPWSSGTRTPWSASAWFRDGDDDEVFVAEPAVGLEVNVTRFLRLDLGAGYRSVSRVARRSSRRAT